MGTAAKTILDALKAVRVPAAAQKRAKDLIDEAHDWDAAQAAEVGAVVSYVCGAAPALPALSKRSAPRADQGGDRDRGRPEEAGLQASERL